MILNFYTYLRTKQYTKNNKDMIYHKKYEFYFNHESPERGNIHKTDQLFGKNHFIDNNYAHFIERYNRRIENFRNYIHSGCFIHFITSIKDTIELKKTLSIAYPSLKFTIITI